MEQYNCKQGTQGSLIAVVFIDEFAKGTRISYFHPRINLKVYLFSAFMARKNKGQES